jgi:acetylornithine/N-succinyldiaminopimelate aminotransferase
VTKTSELHARSRPRGERLRAGLERLPHVVSVRGCGLMLACELDLPAPEVARRALLEQRLIVNATGPTTLRLLPPLIVTDEQIDDALRRLAATLEDADGGAQPLGR